MIQLRADYFAVKEQTYYRWRKEYGGMGTANSGD
jgi:hypothetical protein